jgi:hypothetical protein
MKSLSVRVGVALFVIGLTIFTYAGVWGEDWKSFGTTWQGDLYYDVKSITRPSKDIVRVWTKLITNETGKVAFRSLIEFSRRSPLDAKIEITHNLRLIEYNCIERQSRVLKNDYYSENFILYSEKDIGKWDYVSPESLEEKLLRAVCK